MKRKRVKKGNTINNILKNTGRGNEVTKNIRERKRITLIIIVVQ